MPDHPQIFLEELGVDVDAGIADFLRALVQVGCRTLFSCQGDETSPGYILFADGFSLEAAIKFVSQRCLAVGEYELHGRVIGADRSYVPVAGGLRLVENAEDSLWVFTVGPSYELRSGRSLAAEDPVLSWIVEFPASDLSLLKRVLTVR